jgi:3-oxoacyl-[acyl-carrier protein] reductase
MRKHVIVTGCTSGIGLATFNKFLDAGWEITGISRDKDGKFKYMDGKTIRLIKCDFRTPFSTHNLDLPGPYDVLINNVGAMPLTDFEVMSDVEFMSLLNINLVSMYALCRKVIPKLRKGGCVVNIASISGIVGDSSLIAYSITKAGVIMLTKCLAKRYGSRLRINSISPGFVDTNLVPGPIPKELLEQIPQKRAAEPREIADVIYFMCTKGASYMNGANIVVDGGLIV